MASLAPGDFYYEGKRMVFTEQFHLRRGWCCRAGCRHCPWETMCPAAEKDTRRSGDARNSPAPMMTTSQATT